MRRQFRRGCVWRTVFIGFVLFFALAAGGRANSLTWVEPQSGADLVKLKKNIENKGARIVTLAPEERLLVDQPGVDVELLKSIPGVKAVERMIRNIEPPQPSGQGLGLRRKTLDEQASAGIAPSQVTTVEPNTLSEERASIQGLQSTPAEADNSLSIYFPPIRSQGSQGSCAAWATAYYYNTYTQAKDEGWTVSGGNNTYICSPAFIYNLIDDGVDSGSNLPEAMARLGKNGACSWLLMPYSSSDCTSWPSEAAWTDALQRRTMNCYSIGSETDGATDAEMEAIKQRLANGEIMSTSTDVYANFYNTYPNNTTGINNGVLYANSGAFIGGHALTVVGYDDNKSYNDGSTTKYGAFLIANSWGSGWGTYNSGSTSKGYLWVAYDYFKSTSGCFGAVYYNSDRPKYRSRLYAAVGINSSKRGYIGLSGGAGSTAAPSWISDYAINYDGGVSQAITESKRVVIDLNDGIEFINFPAVDLFARVSVGNSGAASSVTSATFYRDFDGDGSCEPVNSLDPVVPVGAGQTGYATAHFTSNDNTIGRFDFSPIASPQTAWQPIALTATARDAAGLAAAGFNGTATLSGCVESTTTVGTGTAATNAYLAANYNRNRWQSIYLKSELGAATTWTAVVLNVGDTPGQALNNLTIRMKHTTLSKYNTASWDTGWTTVYRHDKAIARTGPARLDFDAPFAYNGANNVMVDFSFENPRTTWAGSLLYTATGSNNRTLYYRDIFNYGPPTSWTGTTPPPQSASNVPNVRLIAGRDVAIAPDVTGNFASGVWTGPITVGGAVDGMFLVATDAEGHTGRSNWFNVQAGLPPGTLTVDIGPAEAVDAGAQWRRTGATTWLAGGYTETVAPGTYSVEFSAVAGWLAPGAQQATVASGQATTISGTYARMNLVWVDYMYAGMELGTVSQPYWTLEHAISAAAIGGTVRVKTGMSNETIRVTKPIRIECLNGPATIGRSQ